MKHTIKEYIELNISKIDNEEWDKFFAGAPHGIGYTLYSCGIDFIDKIKNIYEWMFFDSDISSINIPSNIERINASAFEHCTNLKDLTISEGVMRIGWSAFSYCTSLTEVTIPSSVVEIVDNSFQYCSELKTLILSDNIRTIPSCMCYNCFSLENIHLPDKLEVIGDTAFEGCISLDTVTFPRTLKKIEDAAFSGLALPDINFKGTMEEWQSVVLSPFSFGYDTCNTIKCIDGVTKLRH